MAEILQVKNLETRFETREGTIHAVNGVSFSVNQGETLGIVGESGCGKSVSMMSVMRLIPSPPGKVVSGEAWFHGNDLLKMKDDEIRKIRGSKISVVFQDPMASFNPVIRIGNQVAEPWRIHTGAGKEEALERARKYLELVGIPNPGERLKSYPHQFSGGMLQRVMIAMGLICEPELLIADEPTTALDVTVQAQIIELLKRLQKELNMSMIWISHDLGVIAGLADRVNVMYGGFIVESAKVKDLYKNPMHPYTIGLLGSLPLMDEDAGHRLVSIEGTPPVFYQKPGHCPFYERCKVRVERCASENPTLRVRDGNDHAAACWVDTQTGKEL
ncbi:MAG: ABC transporter ATP-binding protein [Anaerolineaceae bacterium]|nr:ABC transporter ATP-binding protein [Anaerolineaceae bacterium]